MAFAYCLIVAGALLLFAGFAVFAFSKKRAAFDSAHLINSNGSLVFRHSRSRSADVECNQYERPLRRAA
jgi:hypothetical protein